MRIQHNIAALNTNRNLANNNSKINKSLEKLSSGFKINRAGDDAAGLAISEKMRGQIRGLNMAGKNIQDGISLIQTAEGAMNEIHSMLQRIRELTVQSANDTNTDEDRGQIALEVNALLEEIDAISERTEFNGMKLLRGGGTIAPPPSPPGGGGTGSSRGQMLTGDALVQARKDLVNKMVNAALETSEDYIRDLYGVEARDGAEITVKFTKESPGGSVAWVTSWMNTSTGEGVRFELVFDEEDVFTDQELWIDVDRIVAHEMVHAMMSASGMNFYSMPKWFKEGTAEYLPGAKERLTQSVGMVGAERLVNMLDSTSGGSHFYSASYAATMFLDAKLRQQGKTMKDFMGILVGSNGNTPIGTTVSTPGPTLDAAFKQVFGANYGESQFKADFRNNGVAFINDVITKGGIGSIKEVSGETNGLLDFGASESNSGFIPDSGNTLDENDGFKYIWDSSTPYNSLNANPYVVIDTTISATGQLLDRKSVV